MTETYDYIVVGAGSAGCVVARRLSDDPMLTGASTLFRGLQHHSARRSTDPVMSMGGYKQSGFGREMGAESIEAYTQTKSVLMRL